jgi:hypothetical protein
MLLKMAYVASLVLLCVLVKVACCLMAALFVPRKG